MNTMEKSIVSNLEGISQDFGEPKLNNLYKSLDLDTKNKINKHKNLNTKITILQNIADPELQNIYNNLNEKIKT